MPPLTFLETEQLILRPIEQADLPHLVRWINKPEMRNFLAVRTPNSSNAEADWLAQITRPSNPPADIVLAIVHKKGPRLIGLTGLHQIDWINRRAVTGSYLGEACDRGKGYGKASKLAMLEYAFNTLDLRKINSEANADNVASQKCLLACGYTHEGVRRQHLLIAGKAVDSILFGITQDEWRQRNAPAALSSEACRVWLLGKNKILSDHPYLF
ncbi:MAG: GNAT family protein [Patescibacteria group bacterium]